VGVHMAKLATLQLMQPIGAKSTKGSPINQEAGGPPLPSFPYTMLSVKTLKDNMQLGFIEIFFTNYEIKTNV